MESGGGKKCAKKLGYPAGDPVGSQVPQEQSKSQSDSPQSGFGGGHFCRRFWAQARQKSPDSDQGSG